MSAGAATGYLAAFLITDASQSASRQCVKKPPNPLGDEAKRFPYSAATNQKESGNPLYHLSIELSNSTSSTSDSALIPSTSDESTFPSSLTPSPPSRIYRPGDTISGVLTVVPRPSANPSEVPQFLNVKRVDVRAYCESRTLYWNLRPPPKEGESEPAKLTHRERMAMAGNGGGARGYKDGGAARSGGWLFGKFIKEVMLKDSGESLATKAKAGTSSPLQGHLTEHKHEDPFTIAHEWHRAFLHRKTLESATFERPILIPLPRPHRQSAEMDEIDIEDEPVSQQGQTTLPPSWSFDLEIPDNVSSSSLGMTVGECNLHPGAPRELLRVPRAGPPTCIDNERGQVEWVLEAVVTLDNGDGSQQEQAISDTMSDAPPSQQSATLGPTQLDPAAQYDTPGALTSAQTDGSASPVSPSEDKDNVLALDEKGFLQPSPVHLVSRSVFQFLPSPLAGLGLSSGHRKKVKGFTDGPNARVHGAVLVKDDTNNDPISGDPVVPEEPMTERYANWGWLAGDGDTATEDEMATKWSRYLRHCRLYSGGLNRRSGELQIEIALPKTPVCVTHSSRSMDVKVKVDFLGKEGLVSRVKAGAPDPTVNDTLKPGFWSRTRSRSRSRTRARGKDIRNDEALEVGKNCNIEMFEVTILKRTLSRGGGDARPHQLCEAIRHCTFPISQTIAPGSSVTFSLNMDLQSCEPSPLLVDSAIPQTPISSVVPTFKMPNLERTYILHLSMHLRLPQGATSPACTTLSALDPRFATTSPSISLVRIPLHVFPDEQEQLPAFEEAINNDEGRPPRWEDLVAAGEGSMSRPPSYRTQSSVTVRP